jgi:CBS domain-containing protein
MAKKRKLRTRVSVRGKASTRKRTKRPTGTRKTKTTVARQSKGLLKKKSDRPARGLSLDRNIERLRVQLDRLTPFLSNARGQAASSLDELDIETERLIREVLGESSEMIEVYEYAQLGEAGGLVNFPDEAPEGGDGTKDSLRESLNQRKRVLESCIAELEARRAASTKKAPLGPQTVIGPQVADYMSTDIRSVDQNATLEEAAQLMQQYKVGSLLVSDDRYYVGVITDTDLARNVVAQRLDPNSTRVMRKPPVTIEGDQPIIEAVRVMKEKNTRHLAVTEQGSIVGLISVSNILRYYSGVI